MPGKHEYPPTPIDTTPRPSTESLARSVAGLREYLTTLRTRLQQTVPLFYQGSATFDPANLVDGAGETTTVTVTGARLGDLAFTSFSLDLQGITATAYVSASDVVSVRLQNETGGAVNLGSGTVRAAALRLDLV